MGTRLRNVNKDVSETVTTKTGKTMRRSLLGGAHKLTDEVINRLRSYYGKAIHDFMGTEYETLKMVVWAMFFHMTSSDDKPAHHCCPRGVDS